MGKDTVLIYTVPLKNEIEFLLSKEITTITIMKQSMKTSSVMRK